MSLLTNTPQHRPNPGHKATKTNAAAGNATSRFSVASAQTALSSIAWSHLRSVIQMSMSGSQKPSSLRLSIVTIATLGLDTARESGAANADPSKRAQQRQLRPREALQRLLPEALMFQRRKVRDEGPQRAESFSSTRRAEILWRPCCDPVEAAWQSAGFGSMAYPATACGSCELWPVHYHAASPRLPLDEQIMVESVRLRGEECEVWRRTDKYGNTPLIFVAHRPIGILDGVFQILAHLPFFKSPYLAHQNANLQNFLFGLNPYGLGTDLQELPLILAHIRKLLVSSGGGFDFSHRDIHGQTFVHCLVYHPNFRPSRASVRTLRTILSDHLIYDSFDNLGRTFEGRIRKLEEDFRTVDWKFGLSGEKHRPPITKAMTWVEHHKKPPINVGNYRPDPTLFDADGNTAAHWLIQASGFTWRNPMLERYLNIILQKSPRIVFFRNRAGETPLFTAVRLGRPRAVRRLLRQPQVKYDIDNYMGVSLLSAARDELRIAEEAGTEQSLAHYADILCCIVLVLNQDAGLALPPAQHIFREEDSLQ